jgi:hypothetical protein
MIASDLGILFELGFNIGILTYIQQNNLNYSFLHLYHEDLQKLRFSKLVERIIQNENITSQTDREIIKKWSLYFLQKGFLSGYNIFREYLDSITQQNPKNLEKLKIDYYQANFCDQNSFNLNPKGETQTYQALLSHFGNIPVNISRYSQKGEFLKADTLMLIRYKKQVRILVIDVSVFSVKSTEDLKDLNNVELLKRLLFSDISYLKSKSVFSQLSIDTGEKESYLGIEISEDLNRYLTAFQREDKESYKLIQAGGYAYSFHQFLQEQNLILPENDLTINVMGYTDRSVNAIAINSHHLDFLKTCQEIYKKKPTEQEIQASRFQVLKTIQRNASHSFIDGKVFLKSLLELSPKSSKPVIHHEKITNFFNSVDLVPQELMNELNLVGQMELRQAHSTLISQGLSSNIPYLFLTGNPGIGKTTSIVNFLSQNADEGFLFFYISPRTQVNLDIIEKFREHSQLEDLFCLNSTSYILSSNPDKYTVEYFSKKYQGDFNQKNILFKDGTIANKNLSRPAKNLTRTKEDVIIEKKQKKAGVLSSICETVSTIIDDRISHNVVATISIQSLKKLDDHTDTLKHFSKILGSFYNKREACIIPEKLQDFTKRYKNLFIMIDEITGDQSGINFLDGLMTILKEYEIFNYAHILNTKLIIADASLVDIDVINQHLSCAKPEPNKIFYRLANQNSTPLSRKLFKFKNQEALLINSNSYPAKALNITYKVFPEPILYNSETFLNNDKVLIKPVQNEIFLDIIRILKKHPHEQVIIYIQDKLRLKSLIQQLETTLDYFEKFQDYIEIHSQISELEKAKIQTSKEQVNVIFMTASASRGLSFPKAKHILVDIPRFEIEQNLMEIIQVIYRGRGTYLENGETKTLDREEKQLIFYFCEKLIYYKDNPEISLQESLLNIIDILLILKTSIMTRIYGYGKIGNYNIVMIPLGGKSVFAAGETYTNKLENLIKSLKSESRNRPQDTILRNVAYDLTKLLERVQITLQNTLSQTSLSYLSQIHSFQDTFESKVDDNLASLLHLEKLEDCYILGNLLIVPLADQLMREKYELRHQETINNEQFFNNLLAIYYQVDYPLALRIAASSAIELLNQLQSQKDKNMTQILEQTSQRFDQYYAIPLFTLTSQAVMKEYFSRKTANTETEENSFRFCLETYLKTRLPITNVLPIGFVYEEFPFLVFTSYSFNQFRDKLFTDRQLFISHELNILNLILSYQ